MHKLRGSHIFDSWVCFTIFSSYFTFNLFFCNPGSATSYFQDVCGKNVHENVGQIDNCLFFWRLLYLTDPLLNPATHDSLQVFLHNMIVILVEGL